MSIEDTNADSQAELLEYACIDVGLEDEQETSSTPVEMPGDGPLPAKLVLQTHKLWQCG